MPFLAQLILFGPCGEGHTVVRKDIKCSPCYERECKSHDYMQAIQVEDVMEVIELRVEFNFWGGY